MRRSCQAVAIFAAVLTLVLGGCGGGGGSTAGSSTTPPPPPTGSGHPTLDLTLSTKSVSVATFTDSPTPIAQLTVGVSPAPPAGTTVYIAESHSSHAIASVTGSVAGDVLVTITFDSGASLGAGTYTDALTISGCFDPACTQQVNDSPQIVAVTYIVTQSPPPFLRSMSPNDAVAGSAGFTLSVQGAGFDQQAQVLWNGVALPTTFVTGAQLNAQVSAANVATAGTYVVTVSDPGGTPSDGISFTVTPPVPLQAKALWPNSLVAGGAAFTLDVLGQSFAPDAVVQWNGNARTTTVVSSSELLAQIPVSDIASAGSASITVLNTGAASTSNALPLSIGAASKHAVSYQMNPAHTGVVNFNNVSLPASSTWSVNVGGPASYAIIADGRVFVTVTVSSGSELRALDAATGATLWGPLALTGVANATYDNGTLFVTSGNSLLAGILTAIDPATGNSIWTSSVVGDLFPPPPVAAQGVVIAATGGNVNAFDETTGAPLWTTMASGTSGTLALYTDGIYASVPCGTNDLRPLSGTLIWSKNTGCSGGGGDTPVVADGTVFSPINGQYSGSQYDAESGTLLSNFTASVIPAVSPATAFFLHSGTLQGIARSNNQVLWSFTGDGALVTSPIVVNNFVFVGSKNGNLYALDAANNGTQVWSKNVGAPIAANSEIKAVIYTGLAAGDGLLVVPAGNSVTAYTLSTNP